MISYIHHTCDTGNIAQHNNADWDCFQDSDFAGDLDDSKSTLGNYVQVRRPNICTIQLDVQETNLSLTQSYKAEVISLDACLRMDGIPALDLWDLVIEAFHSSSNQTNKTKDVRVLRGNLSANIRPNVRKHFPTNHADQDLTKIDHLPSNGTHSGSNSMLYVFEDNEAVMKMVIRVRIPR